MKAFLVKVGGLWGPWPPASSASGTDPFEAYMHACMSAPFFCYVPPVIDEAMASDEEPGMRDDAHPGDDVRALDRLSPPGA